MTNDKPAADTRRGANWTPPPTDERCFEAALDEGSPSEMCLHCGKHIRNHYGRTEYRCDERTDELIAWARSTYLCKNVGCGRLRKKGLEVCRKCDEAAAEHAPTVPDDIAALRASLARAEDCRTGTCGHCLICYRRQVEGLQEHVDALTLARSQAEADRATLTAEVERLRGAIEQAPHDLHCDMDSLGQDDEERPCDCWKATALKGGTDGR